MTDNPRYHANISLRLRTTEEGGRTEPVWARDYRPQFHILDPASDWGVLIYPEGRVFELGSVYEAPVHFIDRDRVRELIAPGQSFELREGSKVVGDGTLLSFTDH